MGADMYERLKQAFDKYSNIVFLGGAGVSTESGIPDFRGANGLFNKKYPFPPENMLSHDFFVRNPELFFEFYKNEMIYSAALPNKAHTALSQLEKGGRLKTVITQNIDGLHQAAGSVNVIELHGSVHRNFCVSCKKKYSLEKVLSFKGVPKCACGGTIRPDVVLYGESLDDECLIKAAEYVSQADMLIIGGTSLAVYPAAGIVRYFKGDCLVLINKSETGMDDRADLVFHENIGDVLGI